MIEVAYYPVLVGSPTVTDSKIEFSAMRSYAGNVSVVCEREYDGKLIDSIVTAAQMGSINVIADNLDPSTEYIFRINPSLETSGGRWTVFVCTTAETPSLETPTMSGLPVVTTDSIYFQVQTKGATNIIATSSGAKDISVEFHPGYVNIADIYARGLEPGGRYLFNVRAIGGVNSTPWVTFLIGTARA